MKAISHLDGVWCGGPYGLCIGPSTVAAHKLGAGMLPQPRGQGVGGPVGQHIDPLAGLHVQQDRGVHMSPAGGEVVHAQRPCPWLFRPTTQQPQQRVGADRDRQMLGEPSSRASGQDLHEPLEDAPEPWGSAGEPLGQAVDRDRSLSTAVGDVAGGLAWWISL